MCGIAGVARLDGGELTPGTGALLDRLADMLHHRGPDDRETLLAGPVGLAFTRLSLVDPESGGQPLSSEDGSIVLIANGEVYNHRELARGLPAGSRLRTGSDCEVLIHLYRQHGLRFLDDVRGMFAVILWDRARGRLILARDRFGIKPLFYHRNQERIILSSEIKGLFCDPATPRQFAWSQALASPAVVSAPEFTSPGLATWFEGVESVPAATIMEIELSDGTTRSHEYWRMPTEYGDSADPSFYVEQYREALSQAVAECATADTELGLFLSGGVDSSAVLALARPQLDELHTFTAVSGGTLENGDAPETEWLTRQLGVINHPVVFPAGLTPGPDEWRRLVWLTETPMCGPEIYYKHELHRFARAERPELRGMLLGAASDEFNGGYSFDISGGSDWASFEANLGGLSRQTHLAGRGAHRLWDTDRPLISDEVLDPGLDGALDAYRQYLLSEHRKVQQYNVWHEDRTAAGSGVEARVPFLDHRVVEISASVPPRLRQELLWDKEILRRAVADLLPERIVRRPKVPFFYGPGTRHAYRMLMGVLSANGGELVEDALSGAEAGRYLNAANVRQELAELGAGDTDSPRVEMLLRVVNMGLLANLVHDAPRVEAFPSAPVLLSVPAGRPVSSVAAEVGSVARYDLDDVLSLRDDVFLAERHGPGDEWFLVADGQVEYVLTEPTPVLSVLRRLDGSAAVKDVLADAAVEPGAVLEELSELIGEGLVQVSSAPALQRL